MKKIYNIPVIYCVPVFVFLIYQAAFEAYHGGDFDVFLNAAQKLSNHSNIYQPPFIRDLKYYYSPFFALLLIPFSYMPFFISEFIWILFSYWTIFRIIKLSEQYFLPLKTRKEYLFWIALSFICTLRFIISNISMIQLTLFLLWATLEALALFQQKKIWGSLLLAIAINIKLLPIVFLPYLLYRNYFKEFIYAVVFSIILLFLPALFFGLEYNNLLLSEWWKIINPANSEHLVESGLGPHSLTALIPVYLTNTTGELTLKRNFVNLDQNTVSLILNLSRIFLILFSFCFLRTWPFKKAQNKIKFFWEISYLFLITPLIFPHQQKYAFIYLLPQIMYLFYFFIILYKTRLIYKYTPALILFTVIVLILSPISGTDILGQYPYHITIHYKILTIATVFLIPLSLILNPKKLVEIQELYNNSSIKPCPLSA